MKLLRRASSEAWRAEGELAVLCGHDDAIASSHGETAKMGSGEHRDSLCAAFCDVQTARPREGYGRMGCDPRDALDKKGYED